MLVQTGSKALWKLMSILFIVKDILHEQIKPKSLLQFSCTEMAFYFIDIKYICN